MGQVVYLGTRTGRWTSNDRHVEERVSQGRIEFAPVVAQETIDRQEADAAAAALVRKIRPRFVLASIFCFAVGWPFLGSYFLVLALFTRGIVNWLKGTRAA